jgi:cytidyltransferase-like protein
MKKVAVTGSFDNLRSRHIRLLEEASKLGDVIVFLWSDGVIGALEGRSPKFPQHERLYLLQAIRHVSRVVLVEQLTSPGVPESDEFHPDVWVSDEEHDSPTDRAYAANAGIDYRLLRNHQLQGFSVPTSLAPTSPAPHKKVVVTGCFDWLHSGHVRFLEEVSQLGSLHVIIGHDRNISLLKGEGHPMFSQDERRYMVHSVRYVDHTWISSGQGWMDAAPEIVTIRPDLYAVNEDGDKPEKRTFCEQLGIEYIVLKRVPKDGLPARISTAMRGF